MIPSRQKPLQKLLILLCAALSLSSSLAEPKEETVEDIFFVQMSDTHVYSRKSDFTEFSSPPIPWFIPDFLVPWITVKFLTDGYGEDAIEKLRVALVSAGYPGDLSDLSDLEVYEIYAQERSAEPGIFGSLDSQIKSALQEVVALEPQFIINTGDLVLESNNGSPEAIQRWFEYYRTLTKDLPMPIFNTIGNNEIAGTEREGFGEEDPRFGKYFFKQHYQQTHYSFNKGNFRFIALDTHTPEPTPENPNFWNFGKMPSEVSDWLQTELARSSDKTTVILNHEPFHFDSRWPFEEAQTADDEGMFKEFGVNYVLTGHTHLRSEMTIDGIHHLTAGALSGMRWVLPADLHERGYRVFQSAGSELFSIWKRSNEIAIGFASPQPSNQQTLMLAAIDASAPFAIVKVYANDLEIPVKAVGSFFFLIDVPQQVGETLTIVTVDQEGKSNTQMLTYQKQEDVAY